MEGGARAVLLYYLLQTQFITGMYGRVTSSVNDHSAVSPGRSFGFITDFPNNKNTLTNELVPDFCDLGVTFDNKMNFIKHINVIKARASSRLGSDR